MFRLMASKIRRFFKIIISGPILSQKVWGSPKVSNGSKSELLCLLIGGSEITEIYITSGVFPLSQNSEIYTADWFWLGGNGV